MPELDLAQYVVLLATIAGVTELIARARAKDWWVVLTIATSAGVGFLFGLIHYYAGVGPVEGIAYGFAASGALTALGVVGKRSTPAPSDPVTKA